MGTPSLQPFLKSYWLTPVQMTGQLSQSMQIWRARDSINAMPTTITSESSTSPVEFVMATVCKICAGPIEPLDHHLHCVACLGLAHAEAALDKSDCGHCADLPVRVLRARRDMVRGLFGVGLTAASVPLVGPPSPGGGSAVLPCRRTQRSPHSPVSFPEDCFRPPSAPLGKAMGFMVVLQRHLWLNLADLKEADRKVLLNAPVTPSGLFGDAVESITERFAEAQKRAKAMSHVMPRRTFQQQTARSSSAPGSAQRRDIPRPAPGVGTATAPRQEPDVRRKAWGPGRKRQGQRRSPRRDSRLPPAAKPSSWRSEERRRAREQPSSQAPKVHLPKCLCVGCSFNKNAYILTKRAFSSSLNKCSYPCPASEQCRSAAHTG